MASSNAINAQAEMTISISDLSIVSDIRRLLKRIDGVESIVVRKKKTELDLSLEEVKSGKIVNVGSVQGLMDYLNS